MSSAWTLVNVDKQHAAHPETFHVPPLWRRQQFPRGCAVKLIFEDAHGRERMWVRIDERAAGRYCGTLESLPTAIAGVAPGAHVDFGPEHIADWQAPTPPAVAPNLTAALSPALRDPQRFPRFVRRDAPLDANDSGLRLAWADDDAGLSRVPLRDVLAFYESLAPLAQLAETGRWRWNDADCLYERER